MHHLKLSDNFMMLITVVLIDLVLIKCVCNSDEINQYLEKNEKELAEIEDLCFNRYLAI